MYLCFLRAFSTILVGFCSKLEAVVFRMFLSRSELPDLVRSHPDMTSANISGSQTPPPLSATCQPRPTDPPLMWSFLIKSQFLAHGQHVSNARPPLQVADVISGWSLTHDARCACCIVIHAASPATHRGSRGIPSWVTPVE